MEQILYQGKHLRLKANQGWEYAERNNPAGAVIVVAVSDDNELVLVEQYRAPIQAKTIEMPAGLIGDLADTLNESAIESAHRELLEETGFTAQEIEFVSSGPSSAGMSNEMVTFVRARGLTRVSAGGGDASENITVHLIALESAAAFFEQKRNEGYEIDPKLYAGLYFAKHRANGSDW